MRRLLPLLIAALLSLGAAAQDFSTVDSKLDTYFQAIEAAPTADKCEEADFLISSCETAPVQAHVGMYVFNHFKDSPVMGDESVAVYVAQQWILNGKLAVSASERALAESFVRVNGRSLIGMRAPELTLRDINQQEVRLFEGPGEHYTVLLFYDTTCAPCALETEYLKRYLPTAPIPLDVVAVYVGLRESSWARYRASKLNLDGVLHLWDPGMQSDFQFSYGVLKTPSLFLLAPDRTIVGRRLDTKSLSALLDAMTAVEAEQEPPYVYGSRESEAVFDRIFAEYDPVHSAEVLETARYIEERTLPEGNVTGYAHTMGDLLYYLSFHRSEAFREALPSLMDEYIYGRDVWTAEDSVHVFTLAEMMKGLLRKCPVGSPVPDRRVSGTLRRPHRRDRAVTDLRLRKLRGKPGVVVFYADSCASCEEAAPGVDKLLGEGPRRLKVLLVKADETLLDDFDLSLLPHVLWLDKKGIVLRRYVDL